jgi:hypothetical protein
MSAPFRNNSCTRSSLRSETALAKAAFFDDWLLSVLGGPNYAVGVRALDGSAPIRLGEGYGGAFSPDGKWALSFLPGPPPKITILPTAAGEPRAVPIPGIERISGYHLGFFPDGKRIWFSGAESGHPDRTYVQDINGGAPSPVTPDGVLADGVSPDGKFLVGPDPAGRLAGWRCFRWTVGRRVRSPDLTRVNSSCSGVKMDGPCMCAMAG